MSIKKSIVVTGAAALLVSACGPMPGYRGPNADPQEDQAQPRSGPAPAPEEDGNGDWSNDNTDEAPTDETPWETPPSERPPAPVYGPPPSEPATPPVAAPIAPPPAPAQQSGMRVIQVDADTAYLIDDTRGLCFFQFKGTLASIDCDRLGGNKAPPAPAPQPAPVAPKPVPQPARVVPPPAPEPAPVAPQPGSYSTVELRRFQDAFGAIFCDRQAGRQVKAEQRIAEAGLTVERYGAIETWMAEDDGRWWSATDKARSSCR